jgi:hypothetical protein
VFQALWNAGLAKYGEAAGIDWTWLSAGGWKTGAPLALETAGKNPAGRGKKADYRVKKKYPGTQGNLRLGSLWKTIARWQRT